MRKMIVLTSVVAMAVVMFAIVEDVRDGRGLKGDLVRSLQERLAASIKSLCATNGCPEKISNSLTQKHGLNLYGEFSGVRVNDVIYRRQGALSFLLISPGEDGIFETDDDISSAWSLPQIKNESRPLKQGQSL